MTTEQLRKEIEVTNRHLTPKGIHIVYLKWNAETLFMDYVDLNLSEEESISELRSIGEIDEETDNYGWIKENYILSQWDALSLVIRHEYAKSLEVDTNMLEMDAAITAIKNS